MDLHKDGSVVEVWSWQAAPLTPRADEERARRREVGQPGRGEKFFTLHRGTARANDAVAVLAFPERMRSSPES